MLISGAFEKLSNQPIKPSSILTKRNIVFIVLGIVILGSLIASWIVVSNLNKPLDLAPTKPPYNIISTTFIGTSGIAPNGINMTIQNWGSSSWTINSTAQINSFNVTTSPTGTANTLTCASGKSICVLFTMPTSSPWISGNEYTVTFSLSDGWQEIGHSLWAP